MSDENLARRTDIDVVFAGENISETLRKYLISLIYTDNETDAADDLQIKINDRDDVWLTDKLQKVIEATASANLSKKLTTTYKVNAKSGLAIRSGPSAKSKKIGTLTYGKEIEVSAVVSVWASFEYNDIMAYVDTKHITITGTNNADTASKYSTVKYGSKNADVQIMQTLLIELGYNCGAKGANGSFGSDTRTALKAFQKDFGLEVNGICALTTWTALIKATTTSSVAGKDTKGLRIQASIVRKNWNSDGFDKIVDCGEFELDNVNGSGPPNTITFKATSLPYSRSIRQTKKSRAWESYTLRGIANEIAEKNGMACMYESDKDPYFSRVEQITESDIFFLSRLCHSSGTSLKATNNIIVLFDQAAYEAKAPVLTIPRGATGGYTKYNFNTGEADTKYSSCRVSYTDPATGKVIEGIAYADDYDKSNKDNQCLEITVAVGSIGEAITLAGKLLRLHNKYEYTMSFTFPGNPDLLAGNTVLLTGWGPYGGKYIIKQAQHTVDSSGGYTTQITLRRTLEGN